MQTVTHLMQEQAERRGNDIALIYGEQTYTFAALDSLGRRAAQGLRTILPAIDRLISSPYVRARQTAEIVAAEYPDLVVETIDALEPGAEPADVVKWLCGLGGTGVVALVGHEPDLSALVSHLLTGRDEVSVELKKGATCLLECERPGPGECMLRWLLAPGQLRALAAEHA